MLQSSARWIISDYNEVMIKQISEQYKISELLAHLLIVRGITAKEEIELFLSGGQEHFHDPFLFDGMKEAVDRIQLAIRNKERIRIYGDYDADGVSSTTLLFYLFRQLGANYDYYVPHRANEGYGLNQTALDLAFKDNVSLIVTVDNGISAFDEIAYAAGLGIEVIVTDHHEPPEVLPNALAIINPKKPHCSYPFKQLAGVGVAFKLAHALIGRVPLDLIEIAAIGTVADLMPLVGENRLIVKLGLQRMQKSAIPGIRALLQLSGDASKEVTAKQIGYVIAPRLNASGRLGSAENAIKLLTTTDGHEAAQLAGELDLLNKERQILVEQMTQEALEMLEQEKSDKYKVIVLAQTDWNVGVVGIVAAKILDAYYCPTIILSIDPVSGKAKGSARSIPEFDIYEALQACSHLLDHFGGHQAAAGMTLDIDKIPLLREELHNLALVWLAEEDYNRQLTADLTIKLEHVSLETFQQIQVLAPFGMGNASPRFIIEKVKIDEIKTMGKEQQHLKIALCDNASESNRTVEALAFGKGVLTEWISPGATMDLVGELSINEWNGVRKPQIIVQDMRILHTQVFDWRSQNTKGQKMVKWFESSRSSRNSAGSRGVLLMAEQDREQLPEIMESKGCSLWAADFLHGIVPLNDAAMSMQSKDVCELFLYSFPYSINLLSNSLQAFTSAERIYAIFIDHTRKSVASLPSRNTFKTVYALLLQQKQWKADDNLTLKALSNKSGIAAATLEFIIEVFEQLAFVTRNAGIYFCEPVQLKKELSSSRAYQFIQNRTEVEQVLIFSTSKSMAKWITENQMKQENQEFTEEMI